MYVHSSRVCAEAKGKTIERREKEVRDREVKSGVRLVGTGGSAIRGREKPRESGTDERGKEGESETKERRMP